MDLNFTQNYNKDACQRSTNNKGNSIEQTQKHVWNCHSKLKVRTKTGIHIPTKITLTTWYLINCEVLLDIHHNYVTQDNNHTSLMSNYARK